MNNEQSTLLVSEPPHCESHKHDLLQVGRPNVEPFIKHEEINSIGSTTTNPEIVERIEHALQRAAHQLHTSADLMDHTQQNSLGQSGLPIAMNTPQLPLNQQSQPQTQAHTSMQQTLPPHMQQQLGMAFSFAYPAPLGNVALPASTSSVVEEVQAQVKPRPKRKQVKSACINCRKRKTGIIQYSSSIFATWIYCELNLYIS